MSSTPSSTLRRNHFKPLIFSRNERAQIAEPFFLNLSPYLEAWRAGRLADFAFVGAYWMLLIRHLRPKDYKVGPTPWFNELPPNNPALPEFFRGPLYYRLRSSPLAAHSVFYKWYKGEVQLVTTEAVPTSLEVLNLQCERKRLVTVITNVEQFLDETEGRDPYSFLLHDLVHADKFFGDEKLSFEQSQYYRQLKARIEAGEFTPHNKCTKFQKKFEYLISDMNSHPEHMESYLNHILLEAES